MSNSYFKFKQFIIHQDRCAMKVTTDACVFGAWVAKRAQSKEPGANNLLDIGTGTGLLALMVAQQNPQLIIDANEIDEAAFEQAKENIEASGFKNEINLQHQDVLHQSSQRKYDIVISNPPFYENELRSTDKRKNTAHHDESLSLDKLLPVIKNRLNAEGRFYLLLPHKRRKEIERLLKLNELFACKVVRVSQSANHDPIRFMIEGSLNPEYSPEETELLINDETGHYSPQFMKLLKDYYLKL